MSIYAIGDLHLSFEANKPMEIFGQSWKDYENKLKENWIKEINEDDVVILPGDFSWATYIEDTKADFEFINNLPGKKVLIKGNHDYWWGTLNKMSSFVQQNDFKNIDFLMNNSYECNDVIIVGTRGWAFNDTENSEKMLKREVARLELSIKDAKLKDDNKKIICAMHYPPITKGMLENGESSSYLELLKKYNITECIYGHLHGKSHSEAVEGNINGINLKLVSSDYLGFKPWKIK